MCVICPSKLKFGSCCCDFIFWTENIKGKYSFQTATADNFILSGRFWDSAQWRLLRWRISPIYGNRAKPFLFARPAKINCAHLRFALFTTCRFRQSILYTFSLPLLLTTPPPPLACHQSFSSSVFLKTKKKLPIEKRHFDMLHMYMTSVFAKTKP